ncbi:MAG TPA: hypothetical protein VME43_34350 [Bryobacteraceae bacterium]|nr:hypothetical protein [Bryobacteraceae bacterium]
MNLDERIERRAGRGQAPAENGELRTACLGRLGEKIDRLVENLNQNESWARNWAKK